VLISADSMIATCTRTLKDSPLEDTTLLRALSIVSAIAGASGATPEEAIALRDWILDAPDSTIVTFQARRTK